MTAKVFFSYSHKDEVLRDQMETHLAVLKRNGEIESWHDRRLTAGDNWKGTIDSQLEQADIVLLLLSPDFLNSQYCFDIETERALERHRTGLTKVVPIILRPCDWLHSPLKDLQAVPKDAKPIVTWNNIDEAFLNVVQMIRKIIPRDKQTKNGTKAGSVQTLPNYLNTISLDRPAPHNNQRHVIPPLSNLAIEDNPRSSNLRIKKSFTEREKDQFLREGFDFIARFFENSLTELENRNIEIETQFTRVDSNRFTSVIYRNGKAVAKCKIANGQDLQKGISFSFNDNLSENSMNENLSVESDAQSLFFKPLGLQLNRNGDHKQLSLQGAAECYWELLIKPLQ